MLKSFTQFLDMKYMKKIVYQQPTCFIAIEPNFSETFRIFSRKSYNIYKCVYHHYSVCCKSVNLCLNPCDNQYYSRFTIFNNISNNTNQEEAKQMWEFNHEFQLINNTRICHIILQPFLNIPELKLFVIGTVITGRLV